MRSGWAAAAGKAAGSNLAGKVGTPATSSLIQTGSLRGNGAGSDDLPELGGPLLKPKLGATRLNRVSLYARYFEFKRAFCDADYRIDGWDRTRAA